MARHANPPKAAVEHKEDTSKKMESIRLAMDQIEKQYGRGAIMRFGEAAQ